MNDEGHRTGRSVSERPRFGGKDALIEFVQRERKQGRVRPMEKAPPHDGAFRLSDTFGAGVQSTASSVSAGT